MEYLLRKGKYVDAETPDLILLDLNLPRKDGREVLIEIKDNPELKRIPVIILTTSKAEEDIVNMYENHANAYITKPVDFNQFIDVIKGLENFWLSIVKLPSNGR
jgi:chemotaxis family two-component system response regulator Rcp1